MEVKKIVEGMTAPQVAQVIDDNFKAQNAILEEDIAKQNNVIGVSEYKDFSEAEAVNVGDVRKYNGFLYECVEATAGAFDASKWKKSSFKAETERKLSELGSKVLNNCFIGIGSGYTSVRIEGLIPNHVYRVHLKESWENSSENTSAVKFGIYSNNGSSDTTLKSYNIGKDIPSYIDITIPEDSEYINIGGRASEGVEVWFYIEDLWLKTENDIRFNEVFSKIETIKSELTKKDFNNCLMGIGTTYTSTRIEGLIPKHKYRVFVRNTWEDVLTNTDVVKFHIESCNGETCSNLVGYNMGKTIPSYIDITIPEDSEYINIGGRASEGVEVWFYIEDLWLKDETDTSFSDLSSMTYVNYFKGVGTSYVKKDIVGIIPNHKYRIYLQNPSWGVGTDNASAVKLAVAYYVGSSYKTLVNVKVGSEVKSYYDFVTPNEFDSFEIGGRVNDGEKVWFYIVDAESISNNSNTIVELNGGLGELTSKFEDLCKRKGISGNTNYGNKIWNILFTSDAHNKTTYLNRIIDFKNTFADSIDDMLHGGDGVHDKFTDANPFDSIEGGELVLNTIGNHECYDPSNTTGDAINGFAQRKPVYDKFIAPYISNWSNEGNLITQPANASEYGYCYYCKDYTEAKVRLVVLDCMHYDDEQNTWLSEILDDAIEVGYHVVICNHYTPANTFVHDRICTFDSIYNDDYAVIRASLNKMASDIVQQKIDDGLNFICWLFGHFHRDLFGALSDYPKQFCLAVDKTAPGAGYERDSCRSGDGKEQDAFDIISVDTSHGLMTVMRIGNNRDKFMRQKNYMVLDYVNGKLLYNS